MTDTVLLKPEMRPEVILRHVDKRAYSMVARGQPELLVLVTTTVW